MFLPNRIEASSELDVRSLGNVHRRESHYFLAETRAQ